MRGRNDMVDVYIVGSKGIPAKYGGFETFVENLTKRKVSQDIHYYVSCMNNDDRVFEYNGATCFDVPVPMENPAGRILHVSKALSWVEKHIKESEQANMSIVYILGCRIGPLLKKHHRRLNKLGCKVFCNPDGLEWKRDKWNAMEKKILRYCEKCLVLNSDFIICDSLGIQDYVLKTYPTIKKENTAYIAYGSDVSPSTASAEQVQEWLDSKHVSKEGYYLIVGRFVPENNYEVMIREFMASKTKKDLVIITNVEHNKFYSYLQNKLHFEDDPRIRFVGTLYDEQLLKKVRENAFAYIHGHSVGGTNPSLLEALASTKLNLLYDCCFNKEVGKDSSLYWSLDEGNLSSLIDTYDKLDVEEINKYDSMSKEAIVERYNWALIVSEYERELACRKR